MGSPVPPMGYGRRHVDFKLSVRIDSMRHALLPDDGTENAVNRIG